MTLTRRSVALLAVAAVLALLNIWGARDVAVVEALPTLPAVLPDSVAVLQISTPVEKLRLERLSTDEASPEFARWRIVTPLQFPADAAQVRSLLRAFESGLAMDAHVDGGNHEDYGVDDQSGLLVELFAADADVPAAALVVGKPASGPSAFVRIPGSDDVYRADVGGRPRGPQGPPDRRGGRGPMGVGPRTGSPRTRAAADAARRPPSGLRRRVRRRGGP